MSERVEGRSFYRAATFTAVAAGAALRFWNFGDLQLTHWDEGSYVAWPLQIGPYAREETLAVYAPPLYPALNAVALFVCGGDPRAAIAVAALAGVAMILLVARLTKLWFGRIAGGVAALFLALDPFQIGYARMALTETTFTCFVLASLHCVTRMFGSGRTKQAVLAGVLAGLAGATKYHGGFPLVAAALVVPVLAVLRGPRSPKARDALRCTFVAGLAALPIVALVALFVHLDMGFDAFRETRATWTRGYHLWTFAAWWRTVADVADDFGLQSVLYLAPIGAFLAAKRHEARDLVALAAPLVLMLILVPYENYTRLLVPFFALLVPLAAATIDKIATLARLTPLAPWFLAAVITLAILLPRGSHTLYELNQALRTHPGAGYPEMARRLEEQLAREPGAVICVAQHALFPYLQRETAAMVFSTTEPEARERLQSGDYLYLLADQDVRRHAVTAPFVEKLRGTMLFLVDNPLPGPIRYDRVGQRSSNSVEEQTLRLYRIGS